MTKSESLTQLGFNFLKRKCFVSTTTIIFIVMIELVLYTLFLDKDIESLMEHFSMVLGVHMVSLIIPLFVIAIPISILSDIVTEEIYKDSRMFIAFFLHVTLFMIFSLVFTSGFPLAVLVVGLTGLLYWLIDEGIRIWLRKEK
ncbi:hypothetical protein [Chengkuizengella axinellae]|uniref:Uncharacterized protein n=1 Tax=Chengkuizengella axinellae TaxID=3064388 RepID=A0ABT9IU01_9BACL|nr:hypothetical protein [Chengkuizengella sp. 2205SS18-9]MDP5272829.1 hypothetical protein [Chengkuizengella sp. 2205SS18-9]